MNTSARLRNHGAHVLSTAELLSVVLAFGRPGEAEKHLSAAGAILAEPGGLRGIRNSSVAELSAHPGVGEARARAIAAAIELGARIATAEIPDRPVISSPDDVDALMRPRLAHLDREVFVVILLDTKNHVIAAPTVAIGSLNSATIHPREVFKSAIKASADNVILVHNHPSGDVRPSSNDVAVTTRFKRLGDDLGIEVLDHVIVGRDFKSMKESGLM